MAMHRVFTEARQSWGAVLAPAAGDTLTFDVVSISPAGDQVLIRNADNTTTLLSGQGLVCAGNAGAPRSLAGGTIEEIRRIAADGAVIEAVTGINVALSSEATGSGRFNDVLARLAASARSAAAGSAAMAVAAESPAAADGIGRGGVSTDSPVGLHGRSVKPMAVLILLAPVLIVVVAAMWLTTDPAENDRARLRWQFARPEAIPHPADNVLSSARVELGRRLFNDGRLSADGSFSCASCHVGNLGFGDGKALGEGIRKTRLKIHTPSLWNLAWANAFFWNGRAATLEEQALGPIENPDEMGSSREAVVQVLKSDPEYVAAFASAFPEQPEISPVTLAKALASFERTIVSPPTRFDRWLAGNATALNASEKNGFSIFIGKGGCANCHSGWAFTDHAFHDIGLQTNATGRGGVIKRPALARAFKTPTLRELAWSAPYMHNGAFQTLEQVVRHYESGGIDRPTRSPDLPRKLVLSDKERADLVAFLRSLSSDRPPQPASTVASAPSVHVQSVVDLPKVGQKDKKFSLERLRIRAGQSVAIVNDDTQPHNVFIQDPRMSYDSGWQNPGEQVNVLFPLGGDYDVFCGIHPNMRLRVEVEPARK